MRTSIATVCLSGTLEEKLHAAARAGFDGVEIFEQDLIVSPLSPESVRSLSADLGISLDLYQPFRDFEGVDDSQFEINLRRARAKFELMERLGIQTMLLCSNAATATNSSDEQAAQQLNRLGVLADEYAIDVAYEALAWGRFVSEYDHAWRIVESADHPRIGTCLDSFHILSRGTNLDRLRDIPGDRIFYLQLADAPALSIDVLSWSRHHRVFPGEGSWDLPDFLSRIAATGYAGPVSLEVFNDSFRQADTERTAVDGLRSLRWLEAATANRLHGMSTPCADSSARLHAQPVTSHLELRRVPDVGEPNAVDFVEVSTNDLGMLTRQLHQLGFGFTGFHRSKPHIQLWQRGCARIVVSENPNTVDDGPDADNSTVIRGIGFAVDDAEAAMARSALLLATEVPRNQGHGEAVLRGVYAPDGSEVFFRTGDGSTASWTSEFGYMDDERVSSIDHINLAQPAHHFDEAVLFYTSLLELHAQMPEDVPSPSGLIRSQVMASSTGEVRMPLNVMPRSEIGAQIRDSSPTEIERHPEHVAVACSDIFEAATTARARGMKLLAIPDNYYDDLAARFELPHDLLNRLREHHILYDRDESGDFLHFYTATTGSVFFEMVERTGGYSGFGAPNAPVRLAAQHRINTRL